MFLYPLAITLILLAFLSPLFHQHQSVYLVTTAFTLIAAFGDALNALPSVLKSGEAVQALLHGYQGYLPFFDIGMGWTVPALIGLIIGWIWSIIKKNNDVINET
jgi:LIVCS family branched-chain amino acid:cation transporter